MAMIILLLFLHTVVLPHVVPKTFLYYETEGVADRSERHMDAAVLIAQTSIMAGYIILNHVR